LCKNNSRCPFYKRVSKDLEKIDLEFLPHQNVIREFVESKLNKKSATVMYFCGECLKDVWNHYEDTIRR